MSFVGFLSLLELPYSCFYSRDFSVTDQGYRSRQKSLVGIVRDKNRAQQNRAKIVRDKNRA